MSDLATALTERNTVEARLALTKLRIARGELVQKAEVEAHYQALALRIRDHWLSAPARYSALLAAKYGLDAAALHKALDMMVRDRLIEIASQNIPPGGMAEPVHAADPGPR